MKKEEDFEEKEKKIQNFLIEQAQSAIKLRDKDREFHGLEREFIYYLSQMILDYEKSKNIKHPRDVGTVRETILRNFLLNSGYLPKKYSISNSSVRIASINGKISNEIDIAFYNQNELITLMKREDIYEVYPIENVYGVIQVKSNLTKKELKSGFKNLLSFKKLENENKISSKFTLLFAYTSDMKWNEIVREIEIFTKENPKNLFPNAIFILDKGYFIFGDSKKYTITNIDILSLNEVLIYGFPDRQQLNLYNFQSILLELLNKSKTKTIELNSYFRLPFTTENEESYKFRLGAFAEIGNCKIHGNFSRKISSSSLSKIINWCSNSETINPIEAMNIAYNISSNEIKNKESYENVYIYNPENLDLKDILIYTNINSTGEISTPLAYDMIESENMSIWIPYYYSIKENLISGCTKCAKLKK